MNEPYIGFYKFTEPTIIVRDVDLIKKILIEDFDSFSTNEWKVNDKSNPLLATSPCFTSDNEWKINRNTLLPVFTPDKVKKYNSINENFIFCFFVFRISYGIVFTDKGNYSDYERCC